MSLTKYEQDALNNLEYQLEYIQSFIDDHIKGSTTMTARDIYDKFCKEYECVEDPKDFIFGLKAAIKVQKIKGIEGKRGVGYHRVGNFVSKVTKDLDAFSSLIDPLNSFLEKTLVGGRRMPAKDIYKLFSRTNDCMLSEEEFIKGFRLAVTDNKIKGLASFKRAGYGRIKPASSSSVTVKVSPGGADLQYSTSLKLHRHTSIDSKPVFTRVPLYDSKIKLEPIFKVLPEIISEWKENNSKALLRIKQLVHDHEQKGHKTSACLYRYAAAQLMNGDDELSCIGNIDMSEKEVREVVGF